MLCVVSTFNDDAASQLANLLQEMAMGPQSGKRFLRRKLASKPAIYQTAGALTSLYSFTGGNDGRHPVVSKNSNLLI